MLKKILVVDDEEDIIDLIRYNLEKEGYSVATASDGDSALQVAGEFKPDLIILDIMMPGPDGFEVCRQVRLIPGLAQVSIIFLTAKTGEIDQILGLELGADDYIQKPVSPRILVARVKTILRRAAEKVRTETIAAPEILTIDTLEINRQNYTVRIDEKESFFPKKEFELLVLLSSAPGRVFTRENILNSIWGNDVIVGDRTIDVHIRKLREKLGDENFKTIKGVGYKFEA